MKYYSTRQQAPLASLSEAILHSEAPDGGLYMPQGLPKIPGAIFNNLPDMSLSDISYFVANALFSPDIPSAALKKIGEDALNFPMPLVKISDDMYAMELFHGPTATIKDVCARFFVRLLSYFGSGSAANQHVLVATNGNSGSAIAKAISELPGVMFHILYPKDTRPELIRNIVGQNPRLQAIPVDGSIDDCRSMIAAAMDDRQLNSKINLTSANAFNIGVVLPQIIYYFYAWAQAKRLAVKNAPIWIGVPCGNGGGLLAGYMSMLMGLPVDRLVASCNSNDAMRRFFADGEVCAGGSSPSTPACGGHYHRFCSCSDRRATKRTLAFAMDSSCPSNIPRFLAICNNDLSKFKGKICAGSVSDAQILETIAEVKDRHGYELDPHSAVAYRCLSQSMPSGAKGIVMASRCPSSTSAAPLSYAQLAALNSVKPIAATFPALKKILSGK
ncbi:MAG: pyridoxal-phosphate dependent enzyme [Clostridium sp.]|nr:pyridoxal-phosphate dependent enzyme [Clostridium sp.]